MGQAVQCVECGVITVARFTRCPACGGKVETVEVRSTSTPAAVLETPQPKGRSKLLIVVGVIGSILHVGDNLTSRGDFVVERFIRGAPFLAPLLFSNMGALGLIALLDPVEQRR